MPPEGPFDPRTPKPVKTSCSNPSFLRRSTEPTPLPSIRSEFDSTSGDHTSPRLRSCPQYRPCVERSSNKCRKNVENYVQQHSGAALTTSVLKRPSNA